MPLSLQSRKTRSLMVQALMASCILGLLVYLGYNAATNMKEAGITSGFGFLWEKARYDISYSLIAYDSNESTHFNAWMVGLVNTLAFAAIAIVVTTFLSLFLAIFRLSSNWLLSSLSYCIVEYVRNIPILIHLFVWYTIGLSLPPVRSAINFGDAVFLSNRGLIMPETTLLYSLLQTMTIFVLAMLALWVVKRAKLSQVMRYPGYVLALLVPFLAAHLVLGPMFSATTPVLKGFNFVGGMAIPPEFITIIIAVSLYSSTHGAEIIRGSILAVSRGQSEAGLALGVHPGIVMNRIVIPQALRSIVPPMTSVYINVLKSAALGSIVGFIDVMGSIGGSSLNLTGQVIECIFIVMVTYTILNLIISFAMGKVNDAVQLKER